MFSATRWRPFANLAARIMLMNLCRMWSTLLSMLRVCKSQQEALPTNVIMRLFRAWSDLLLDDESVQQLLLQHLCVTQPRQQNSRGIPIYPKDPATNASLTLQPPSQHPNVHDRTPHPLQPQNLQQPICTADDQKKKDPQCTRSHLALSTHTQHHQMKNEPLPWSFSSISNS